MEKPQGWSEQFNSNFNFDELKQLISQTEDDEFFHLTCHVDENLREKIEKGGYVDLHKLLPRNRFQSLSEEQKMQFVNKNGVSYWVAVDSDQQRISGIRRWEQAFRIYAAIYCKSQPHRSAEIWQYLYVINTAAASYNWENVAYYDFTFRHLMAEHLQRSWS